MRTKPEFRVGDRGEGQKQGIVRDVFQFAGLWWLAFKGEPNWRYEPSQFKRVAYQPAR